MRDILRKLLVIVVVGPWVLLLGPIFFIMTFPMCVLVTLMTKDSPPWIWKYNWSFSTAIFYGFYCLLTGHKTPSEEFWRI